MKKNLLFAVSILILTTILSSVYSSAIQPLGSGNSWTKITGEAIDNFICAVNGKYGTVFTVENPTTGILSILNLKTGKILNNENAHFYQAVYGNNIYVVTGGYLNAPPGTDPGCVAVSTDGDNWQIVNIPVFPSTIIYTGSEFYIFGIGYVDKVRSELILQSSDGLHWSKLSGVVQNHDGRFTEPFYFGGVVGCPFNYSFEKKATVSFFSEGGSGYTYEFLGAYVSRILMIHRQLCFIGYKYSSTGVYPAIWYVVDGKINEIDYKDQTGKFNDFIAFRDTMYALGDIVVKTNDGINWTLCPYSMPDIYSITHGTQNLYISWGNGTNNSITTINYSTGSWSTTEVNNLPVPYAKIIEADNKLYAYGQGGIYELTDVEPIPTKLTPFIDVPAGYPHEEAIKWCYENNISVGSNNRFGPEDSLTEAHFAVMLARYGQLQIDSTYKGTHYADKFYKALEGLKLPLYAYSDPSFKDKPINRGRIAQIIAAVYGFDYGVEEAIIFMYQNNFSAGMSKAERTIATYGKDLNFTRAAAAAFLQRMSKVTQVSDIYGKIKTVGPRQIFGIN